MLNKCIFIGRLTKDPEIKMAGNVKVANFRIAVQRRYKKKDEDRPAVDFIPVTTWRSSAEFAEKYFEKGKLVFVVGDLETYSYEKDGERINSFCINAGEVGFAESKKSENADNQRDGNTESDFADFGEFEPGDDDLPF